MFLLRYTTIASYSRHDPKHIAIETAKLFLATVVPRVFRQALETVRHESDIYVLHTIRMAAIVFVTTYVIEFRVGYCLHVGHRDVCISSYSTSRSRYYHRIII